MGEQALTSRAACHEGFSDRVEGILFTITNVRPVSAGKKPYSLICKFEIEMVFFVHKGLKGWKQGWDRFLAGGSCWWRVLPPH